MGPTKKTLKNRVAEFAGDGMIEVGQVMMCSHCNTRVEWSKSDTRKKHISSESHKKAKQQQKSSKKRQQTFGEALETAKKRKDEKHTFILDTVEALVASNIPLHNVDHPAFQNWLHKYMPGGGDLPKSPTLREKYVPELRQIKFEELKEILKEKVIVIYCDETTDSSGRAVFNILLQTVTPSDTQKLYLASSVIVDLVNSSSCANAILECLMKMEKNINDVVAVVSDSAWCMCKCVRILKGLNPSLLHVQCWPHKLHNAANTFQKTLPELNKAVMKVKKVFLHARKRSNEYLIFLQEKFPTEKSKWTLFPIPCITRWNSWKKSVNYLNTHFNDIMEFLEGEQDESENDDNEEEEEEDHSKDSKCIQYLKKLTGQEREEIQVQAEFVAAKCKEEEILIQLLQTNKFPTSHLIYQKIDKDPAKDYLLGLEALLSPRNLARSPLPAEEVKKSLQHIPFAKTIPLHDFMAGWSALSTLVKEEMKKPDFKTIKLVELLCALKMDYPDFASKCLQAIWIFPSNANSERSIRACNIVVNDLRRRLKPENAETLNIIYFNRNEEERQESYNPFREEFEDLGEETLMEFLGM
ncbi:CGG triplet repeat-binding protein 1 [Frankliniella fusca]|uniref:CGG triplet repeat-binding protein 1 n=1 Tax=Frankliniella fusca TaxID=407009 RepID=A0AAE1I357_9NEOP|nr:CGG triplet repeat-binding protein 1 [Frankliniella fusca]